jgi:hypothetical protein
MKFPGLNTTVEINCLSESAEAMPFWAAITLRLLCQAVKRDWFNDTFLSLADLSCHNRFIDGQTKLTIACCQKLPSLGGVNFFRAETPQGNLLIYITIRRWIAVVVIYDDINIG